MKTSLFTSLGSSLLLLVLAVQPMDAREFADDFAVVMIDAATEAKLGAFPYDRAVLAKGVEACVRLHAKAVVLKFFLDRPRSAAGDRALTDAMEKIPVALQARLDPGEGTTTALPARFRWPGSQVRVGARGNRGWIPLPAFAGAAAKVGFVDFERSTVPLVEEYRGVLYPSLVISALELATGGTASIKTDGRVELGGGYLPVDDHNEYVAAVRRPEGIPSLSFLRLIEGGLSEREVAGKVVVIGLDTPQAPRVKVRTEAGETVEIGLHRFFVLCLAASYRELDRSRPTAQGWAGGPIQAQRSWR